MNDVRTLCDSIFKSIERWVPELNVPGPRGTLGFGIAQKCYAQVDRILDVCVEETVRVCGDRGMEAVVVCGEGKPLDHLTFGQRVKILEYLDKDLAQVARPLVLTLKGRVMGKRELALLKTLTRGRNDFAHGRAWVDSAALIELLAQAREFCESQLIRTVSALQQRSQQNREGELPEP